MRRRVSGTGGSRSASAPDLRRNTRALVKPFGAVALIGLATVLLPPYERPWWVTGLAVLSLVSVVVTYALASRRSERSRLDPWPAYLMFPYAVLLHDAAGAGSGGSASGMTVMILLPILWLALTGTPRQLWVASGLAILTFAVPGVVIGPPAYHLGGWRRARGRAPLRLVGHPEAQNQK